MSIVWGARVLRLKLPERVAGPDLMNALAGRAAEKGYRVFLLGTSDENLQQLKKKFCASWPGLNVVGIYSPPMSEKFTPDQTAAIIERVRAAKPDILFVGLSCPKQERWIAENLQQIQVPVSLGVGAAFDFLAGRIPRAPEWLRRRGLEWVHRLWCEPGRLWRRYLIGNSVFLYLLFRERIKFKLAKKRFSASS